MFRHVIVGVDGRPNGRDAITLGLQLVDHDGRISLAYVHPGESAPRRASNPEFDRVQHEQAVELLDRERQALEVDADLLSVGSESVGVGLHRLAEEHEADLLVVGSCHRGRAGRVLLTDNTLAALDGAPCTVAVASAGYAGAARPLGSIGVAYDGTPQSEVALAVARALATREDAGVRALRVLAYPVTPYMTEAPTLWEDACKEQLEAARRELELPGEVEGEVVMGRLDDALETFSGEVNLLVVGSRDRGPLRRALLGSTSAHLAHSSRCPLIVVARGVASPPAVSVSGEGDDADQA